MSVRTLIKHHLRSEPGTRKGQGADALRHQCVDLVHRLSRAPLRLSSLDVLGWLSDAPAEPPTGSRADVPRRSHKTSTSTSACRSFRRTTTITCAVRRRQGPCLGHHTSSAGRQSTSLLLCRPTPFGQTFAPTRIPTRFTWRCCCFCSIQRDKPREIRACGVYDYSLPTVLTTNLRSQHLLCRRRPVQLPTWAS
jgi:hypothetical protein